MVEIGNVVRLQSYQTYNDAIILVLKLLKRFKEARGGSHRFFISQSKFRV